MAVENVGQSVGQITNLVHIFKKYCMNNIALHHPQIINPNDLGQAFTYPVKYLNSDQMFCRDINGSQTTYHYDSGDSMIILEVQICGFYLDNY